MKNIQIILVIAILVLIYLISMQWLGGQKPLAPLPEDVAPTSVISEKPVVVVENTMPPETTQPAITTTAATTTTTPEETKTKNPDLIEYKNTNY
ncbi:MAG: hypothetical protein WCK88_01975 [bacterium]